MTTRIELARKGVITDETRRVAELERVSPEHVVAGMADGTVIIAKNTLRGRGDVPDIEPLGVGRGLRTKVNANIGSSQDRADASEELQKLSAAIGAGADAVMDLSTGGDVASIRKAVISASTVSIGTVPIYQAAVDSRLRGKSFVELTPDEMFEAVERHADDGVDFVTVHVGVTKRSIGRIKKEGRIMGVVSRGGALTAEWMEYNEAENPFYSDFARLVEIARKRDMTLSLGDGLRPGCLSDATDRGQVDELVTLGELASYALGEGVQVMVEGPGHVPLNQIEANILLQKRLCHGAPFYVLGPLVTDIAPGYDHITSAIGGAIAAASGADFLCYVTPSEHLRLPDASDVREGVIASRIAAHAGDIVKGTGEGIARDVRMARARKALDWDEQIRLSIDPSRSRALRESSRPSDDEVCTMCGSLCAIKITAKKATTA
jgi:phosphomethylpyrimidine synthase